MVYFRFTDLRASPGSLLNEDIMISIIHPPLYLTLAFHAS